jgi:hypothetical protein
MDMTYDEYIDYVNHLFLQEFTDFDYHFSLSQSTDKALEIES